MVLIRKRTLDSARRFSCGLHAGVFGNATYEDNSLAPLPGVSKQTELLSTTLSDVHGVGIDEQNLTFGVDLRTDELKASFANAIASAGTGSILFLYFAGHGEKSVGGELYLCGTDTKIGCIEESALSTKLLGRMLEKSKAAGVLLVLDCCKSAGFAEEAPRFFTQGDTSDFRILLSASRSGERSWELADGSGTLFSRFFIEAIQGAVDGPAEGGAIYFSDLLTNIQDRLTEEFKKRPGHMRQEPRFAGSYARDPLLFVLRDLTLEQVQVRRARYTRRQLRRFAIRASLGTLAAVLFLLGTHLSWISRHSYLTLTQDGVLYQRGYPGWNAYGFPKDDWLFDLDEGDLEDSGKLLNSKVLVAPLGEDARDLLIDELKPVSKALWHAKSGNTDAALALLRSEFAGHAGKASDGLVKAIRTWISIGVAEDLGSFKKATESENFIIRETAMLGVLRLDREYALERLLKDVARQDPLYNHVWAVAAITGECSALAQDYLEANLSENVGVSTRFVLDSLDRLECEPPDISTLLEAAMDGSGEEKDIAIYGWEKHGEALAYAAIDRLDNAIGRPDLIADFVAALPKAPCFKLPPADQVTDEGKKWKILKAQIIHCDDVELTGAFNQDRLEVEIVLQLRGKKFNWIIQLDEALSSDRETILIDTAELLPAEEWVTSSLRAYFKHSNNRWSIARAMWRLGVEPLDVVGLTDPDDAALAETVLAWRHYARPAGAPDLLVERLFDPLISVTMLPIWLHSYEGEFDVELDHKLRTGNDDERSASIAYTAMFAGAEYAMEKLSDPTPDVRAWALNYLEERDNLEEVTILASNFPIWNAIEFRLVQAEENRARIRAWIGEAPDEMKTWRAETQILMCQLQENPGCLWAARQYCDQLPSAYPPIPCREP